MIEDVLNGWHDLFITRPNQKIAPLPIPSSKMAEVDESGEQFYPCGFMGSAFCGFDPIDPKRT